MQAGTINHIIQIEREYARKLIETKQKIKQENDKWLENEIQQLEVIFDDRREVIDQQLDEYIDNNQKRLDDLKQQHLLEMQSLRDKVEKEKKRIKQELRELLSAPMS